MSKNKNTGKKGRKIIAVLTLKDKRAAKKAKQKSKSLITDDVYDRHLFLI